MADEQTTRLPEERPRSTFREYLEALIVATIFLGFSNNFAMKTFYIPSRSMEDTLLVGDHLFVNRFIYGATTSGLERSLLPSREVERGDIVIFRSPKEPQTDLVKRCIAVAGDVVEIVDKQLSINGERFDDEAFAVYKDPNIYRSQNRRYGSRDNFGPITVEPGHIFCLGDNRDESYDSRYWGQVPLELVKGRAFLIYWSYGGETPDGKWRGWGHRMRQLARTTGGFVTRTRWSRTFHLVQ